MNYDWWEINAYQMSEMIKEKRMTKRKSYLYYKSQKSSTNTSDKNYFIIVWIWV